MMRTAFSMPPELSESDPLSAAGVRALDEERLDDPFEQSRPAGSEWRSALWAGRDALFAVFADDVALGALKDGRRHGFQADGAVQADGEIDQSFSFPEDPEGLV